MAAAGPFRKTRLAPTPSGFLHLGNILSFALTAALAEKTGAGIFLRIDDMDRERANPAYIQDIFDTLHFLGIPWTEGPQNPQELQEHYSQVHRLTLYDQALDKLRETGLVYACNCSRAQIQQNSPEGIYPGTCRHKGLQLDAPGVAWRLNTEHAEPISVKLADGTSVQATLPTTMQDVVIRKKDGFPAYQLSSIVDDVFFGTDLIVRGYDLWPSTLVQLHIASLLKEDAFLNTAFFHHRLLLDEHQRKLSKSAGDTSVHYLHQQGFSAEEVYERLGKALGLSEPVKHWWNLGFMVQ
ncbi:MAG: glutamate--tRNA ligase family protein [Bacteroidia bacterium]|nr:glutamate--tRNA ligase family protein [Bacteroidia bacterium]